MFFLPVGITTNESNEFFLMVPPVKRRMDRSLGAASSQSFTASKGSVTKVDLPLALRALTSSFSNLDIAVNVKEKDSKTIMFYLLNEDGASTDYCPAVYVYSTIATKAITYTYYTVASPSTAAGLGEREQSFAALLQVHVHYLCYNCYTAMGNSW